MLEELDTNPAKETFCAIVDWGNVLPVEENMDADVVGDLEMEEKKGEGPNTGA